MRRCRELSLAIIMSDARGRTLARRIEMKVDRNLAATGLPRAFPTIDNARLLARRVARHVVMVGLFALVAIAPLADASSQNSGYLTGRELDFRALLGPP